jgi:hypothetical protein
LSMVSLNSLSNNNRPPYKGIVVVDRFPSPPPSFILLSPNAAAAAAFSFLSIVI